MENKTLFAFILGAAAGAGITYLCVKSHYEEVANKEIEETREYYRQLENELEEEYSEKIASDLEEKVVKNGPIVDIFGKNEAKKPENDPDDQEKYDKIIEKLNYGQFYKGENEEAPIEKRDKPYEISDEDWDENNGYSKVWLSFYEDDEVFTDDCDNVVDNGIDLIGENNLTEFGNYEENTLYVRNDKFGTDYMVTLEHTSYHSQFGED